MESSTILTADVLDILFEGRNKDYGAYDLRRTYRKRLTVSITVMLSMICMLFIGFAFAGKKTKIDPVFDTKEITLSSVKTPDKPVELPPPPVKTPAAPAQMKTIADVVPKIVPDNQVKPEEMPPVNDDLENVKIGNVTNPNGADDDGTVTGPIGDGVVKGLIEQPQKADEEEDGIVLKVEIESEYPGGPSAWVRFLKKSLNYPQDAIENGVQGAVVVQFIVDKEGNVSEVQAVSGPEDLRAEAVRVIKRSGKWTPAIQNGHKVKSYKRQPIGFQLASE
ncbi:energy transducer TonB [Niastella koreensis]|uniref:Outer membrane transport energization protein TonB n=2 Tax=Niastella koreensis TaxID=354356 RepID=G8TRX0_NIAKG|nr:energy transducer TonB [Niastella koreensis]AEW03305.1 outer membrane transport energization protein TonB [Niastella koreensis GR20-10]OQP55592.1 energy transducer TonB [Niastella koreensis]